MLLFRSTIGAMPLRGIAPYVIGGWDDTGGAVECSDTSIYTFIPGKFSDAVFPPSTGNACPVT